jgi:chromosome partitioning protein
MELQMSKIIALLQQKGGASKTTNSINLLRAIQKDGHKVLLVDSDPQGSARDWNAINEGELFPVVGLDRKTLATDIQSIKNQFDYVIIDGAPQIAELSVAAIKCADAILIPVQPSPFDIWSSEELVQLIKARQEITDGKPKAAFLVSRVIRNTNLGKDVNEALESYGLPIFKSFTNQRISYAESIAKGETVMESKDDAAIKEIQAIKNELYAFMQ